ncbi:hypothetical protein NQ317_015745 [Molorchus minor]|uniref:lysozyme n=1 Tax=Molorchus minor TaxID=1323400 RepID=A0ABQ9J9Z1_9CUCU|nr:hypothetical protein NQ317_015745 [Molorchus minor]
MANLIPFVFVILSVTFCLSEGKVFEHESRYDTSPINHVTGDHGIFQISQIYWCSNDNRPGKACKTTCDKFRDEHLDDDIRCIKKIYEEHQRLSGNGFNAWTVYTKYCAGDNSHYAKGCY